MNSTTQNGRAAAVTIGPPLDYSFQDLHHMKELPDHEPTGGKAKPKQDQEAEENVNANNLKIVIDQNKDKEKVKENETGKLHLELMTTSMKVSYNHLKGLDGFQPAIEAVMHSPSSLHWLDLSHNHLTSIDPVLLKYPELRVLYLHGNQICKLSELQKLSRLPRLIKLTLHGNPVEENSIYRKYVVSTLPNLMSLDFIRVTPRDKDLATVWNESRRRRQSR